jgi:hypothetical protein
MPSPNEARSAATETSVWAELERLADEAVNAIGNAPGLRRIVEESHRAGYEHGVRKGMARMREMAAEVCDRRALAVPSSMATTRYEVERAAEKIRALPCAPGVEGDTK